MTQREAWLKLAKLWDKPSAGTGGGVCVRLFEGELYGLCCCVGALWMRGLISTEADESMKAKIRALPRNQGSYVWATNRTGARRRAAFCRKMAAKLAKRKKA